MSDKVSLPPEGLYQHFKGAHYRLLSIGRHSETEEQFAIYHPVGRPNEIWLRPLAMFCQSVLHEGRQCPRFRYLSDEE